MDRLLDRLKDHWAASGVQVRPGLDDREMDGFERANGVRLTGELAAYFRSVDGMEEGNSDADLFEFFPLRRLTNIVSEFGGIARGCTTSSGGDWVHGEPTAWYVFCDFMIASHLYAVRLGADRTDESPVIWIAGFITDGVGSRSPYSGNLRMKYGEVAPSFAEFLRLYLDDPVGLWPR